MSVTDYERKQLVLIKELFLWTREVMPVTAENRRRQTEFAARLQALLEGREGAA
jgi:hypothetical protein